MRSQTQSIRYAYRGHSAIATAAIVKKYTGDRKQT